jgi:7-cyano-7-deazaguanine reductase
MIAFPGSTIAMPSVEHSQLGKPTVYADRYDASLLFPILRAPARAAIGVPAELPFCGVDIWNAYEFSWLDPRGKPQVAVAEFRVPAQSPNIIESKSFKLYLNGFAGERLAAGQLQTMLERDLATAAGAPVAVHLQPLAGIEQGAIAEPAGTLLDALDIDIDCYGPPNAQFLTSATHAADERLVSHLLKSNCPETGQPDWASVQISYSGPAIDHAGLLRYLVSYRSHSGFHEQCVEQIWMDIARRCSPARLEVYARYTRRGGLDINPWRSSEPGSPANTRGARQ